MSAPVAASAPTAPRADRRRPGSNGLGRFLSAVPEIVAAVLARIEADLPELVVTPWRSRAADEEFLGFELRRRLELCVRGTGFGEADLARFAGHFAAMAHRGAPLPLLQRFCRAATVDIFSELWARAEPGDVSDLLRLSRWFVRYNGEVERVLVRTYEALLDPARQQADRDSAVAARLLAGIDDEPADIGAHLAPEYLVVALAAPARERDLPAGTLDTVADGRHLLLVPVGEPSARAAVWSEVATWAAGQDGLRAAGVHAPRRAAIPAAATTAGSLLGAACAIGLPAGLVGRRDLVLETVLAAHPEGLRQVASVLDPLDGDPRLIDTLSTFFANDLDRSRTAAALSLSRGGLALRLDRISVLTGLDPRSTRGIQVLASALAARVLPGRARQSAGRIERGSHRSLR